MAAPTFVQANTGWVVTTGTGNGTLAGTTAGNFIVLHMVQDGTGASGDFSVAAGSNLENLAGTDNAITGFQPTGLSAYNQVGNPDAARQRLMYARSLGGTVTVTASVGASGDDVYCRIYEFTNVTTGTLITDIVENSSAGAGANGFGTSTTVSDTGVTTLGVDRLACNFVGINDDATGLPAFTGETGGDWGLTASFESATGTDATVALMTAAMAAAGTINGGTATITSDGWGVIGFALIGTTVSTPAPPLMVSLDAVNRSSVW